MSEGHWIVNTVISGHNLSFNMDTLITMWSVMLVLIIVAFISTRKLSVIPNKFQAFCETIMQFLWGLTDMMVKKDGRKHVPLVASLFLFIVSANLMGQLPLRLIHLQHGEIASPTNDLNLTAAMAIIVLVYYVTAGIMKKKAKFFLHGFDFISIILALVEILEMFTRPLTLALRLFGNILAGEILVGTILGMCAYGAPLPAMFFEVLVAFVQALVFTMLTLVYISSATGEEH